MVHSIHCISVWSGYKQHYQQPNNPPGDLCAMHWAGVKDSQPWFSNAFQQHFPCIQFWSVCSQFDPQPQQCMLILSTITASLLSEQNHAGTSCLCQGIPRPMISFVWQYDNLRYCVMFESSSRIVCEVQFILCCRVNLFSGVY